MKQDISICWLRRDLRLFDNVALYHALKDKYPVLPVFIFDTKILEKLPDTKDKRVFFIYHSIEELNSILKDNGSALYVLHDTPLLAFEKICDGFSVKAVFTNHDYEPYARERDTAIGNFLKTKNIPFHTYKDQVIFEKSEVMKPDGPPYSIFTPYSKLWKQKYAAEKPGDFQTSDYFFNLAKVKPFAIPSLKDLGFEKPAMIIPKPIIDEQVIRHYHETRNMPAIAGTSHISIHLRFGTVSIRQLAKLADRLNEQWLNELIWREFFMMILFHFPQVVNHSFKKKYEHIQWRNNEKEFELWCKGETGYPMVDAGMRQLNETGWMHNRVRMVVASFLTKHLLIDWRWGEAYFAEKLLDYELSSNNGNWQWAAGSGCDAAPYFRIFNPSEQLKKFDPELKYIKTWIKDFRPDYLPPIVEHDYARKRALEVYKKSLNEV
ncbi:MAG: cryptochrome/photolyase family protein [Chitinophagaceae bacterium]